MKSQLLITPRCIWELLNGCQGPLVYGHDRLNERRGGHVQLGSGMMCVAVVWVVLHQSHISSPPPLNPAQRSHSSTPPL